jgi:hypothetical protein
MKNTSSLRTSNVEEYKQTTRDDDEADEKVLEQSTKLQVESQMNNENESIQSKTKTTTTTGGKRKSFSNKRKRKKKRKQPQKQKQQENKIENEKIIHGVRNENFTRYSDGSSEGGSNYEIVSNIVMTTSTPKASTRKSK